MTSVIGLGGGEGLVIRRENCSYFLSMRSGMAVVGMGMR